MNRLEQIVIDTDFVMIREKIEQKCAECSRIICICHGSNYWKDHMRGDAQLVG